MKAAAKKVIDQAPRLDMKEFGERRERFLSKLLPNSVAIVVSTPHHLRNNDTEYPFRQSSDVLYLSNFPEPETVLIFTNLKDKPPFTMLVRPKDRTHEIWTGKRFGVEGAKSKFGCDLAYTTDQFSVVLKDLLSKAENVYYKFGRNPEFDRLLKAEWVPASLPLHNPEVILHDMRIIKSRGELALMRHSADISAQAHCTAMKLCRPGMLEYQLQAEIERQFLTAGARSTAYGSIVAGGANAVTLHYVDNNCALKDGDLVLIDAGGEYQGYASDITRTFPVNGKFSKSQKEIYQLVLDAVFAVIEASKPGTSLAKLHDLACDVLRQGLIELGILSKAMKDKHAEAKALEKAKKNDKAGTPLVLRDLYMHGTSHWLGLDVHDIGTIGTRSQFLKTIPLKPGMIFTVEPALYFDPSDKRIPARYRGIGIRIEDDVAVTKTGCEVITDAVPKTIKDIEQLMNERQ